MRFALAIGLVGISGLVACGGSPASNESVGHVDQASSTSKPTVIATFNPDYAEYPEGITVPNAGPEAGNIFFSFIFRVQLMKLGNPAPYSWIADPTDRVGAGLGADAAGNLYWAIGALGFDGTAPPGIYKVPQGGGEAQWFSVGFFPAFANGVEVVGNTAYWTDSVAGTVNATNLTTQQSTVWSADPSLGGNFGPPACPDVPTLPFPFGANGITHVGNTLYITNTQKATVLEIPINADGSAGAVRQIVQSCALLGGADGVAAKGSHLYVCNQEANAIIDVNPASGTASIALQGAPLDRPSSIFLDTSGGQKRLLETNIATEPGGAGPSIISFKGD